MSSEEEMLALTAQKGDVAIRSDESRTYILKEAPPSVKENWLELQTPDCKILAENFGQTSSADLTDGETILHATDTIILNGGNA